MIATLVITTIGQTNPFGAGPLAESVYGALVVGTRISLVMVFLPFLGDTGIPALAKAALAVLMTGLLAAGGGIALPAVAHAGGLALLLLREAALGLVLALGAHCVIEAAQLAGQLAGFQIGLSLVNVIDPQTAVDTPVLSILHRWLGLMIFLHLNAHHWLLRAAARSFEVVPPSSALLPAASLLGVVRAAGGMWLSAVELAAPLLVVTMIADVALGFLGRVSPQLPVLIFGLAVKPLLGLTVMVATVSAWPWFFAHRLEQALALGERLLHLAR